MNSKTATNNQIEKVSSSETTYLVLTKSSFGTIFVLETNKLLKYNQNKICDLLQTSLF